MTNTLEKRDIHLGIDYGTSASKLVLRDYDAPGGERAYIIRTTSGYRFSSTVLWKSGDLIIGQDPSDSLDEGGMAYRSIKMQVADEVKGQAGRYYYGPKMEFPDGLSAQDFAVLSVWWLISEGERAAATIVQSSNLRMGMTLGIPMSFRADSELSDAFLKIARSAWLLRRKFGLLGDRKVPLENAREFLQQAYSDLAKMPPIPTDQIVNWLRSEAEASMLGPFRSPTIPAGPYFKVDIGAGTTNSSIFRIVEEYIGDRWVKSKMGFFGADSRPVGMDIIDRALAVYQGRDPGSCLELRGTENAILKVAGARNAVEAEYETIRDVLVSAWRGGYRNISGPYELPNWEKAEAFVIGGGSLIESLSQFVTKHPQDQMDHYVDRRPLDVPTDLFLDDNTRPNADIMPFMMVAYGLSNLGLAVPESDTPANIAEISQLAKMRRSSHDEIYGDG